MRVIAYILAVVFSLCFIGGLFWGCLESVAFDRDYYMGEYARLDREAATGMTREEFGQATQALFAYVRGERDDLDVTAQAGGVHRDVFSQRVGERRIAGERFDDEGPGWAPLNPAGHFNPRVFEQLGRGEELTLPNLGLETVHHVHADDVAQAFMGAITHWSSAVGEGFHTVSPAALTLRGYAEAMADWFGQPARLRYLPWDEWKATVAPEEAQATWEHIARSPNCSIDKARRLLGYQPRYSSLQAVQESASWLIDHGQIAL